MGYEDFLPYVNKGYNNFGEQNEEEDKKKYERGLIDRVFGVLQNTSVTNALYNMTDDDKETGVLEGIGKGVLQMNPFEDDVTERHTTSDVLGNLGWNPESTAGKVGKGVVGFAGDVLLDPLTYLTGGLSAIPKVLKGTGTAVHTAEGIKKIAGLSIEDATKAMDNVYKARKIDPSTIDEAVRAKDIENLQNEINKKLFKINKDGSDVTFGVGNLPFSSKIATGEDKTLASFKKTLFTNDQLRELGDKTVAPYWNELSQKISNSNIAKKFQKDTDLVELAKTNPVEASMKYKIYKMNDKIDTELFEKDMHSFESANNTEKMWNDFTPDEKTEFVNWYENGGFKDEINKKQTINKVRRKVAKRTGQEVKVSDDKLNRFSELMTELYNNSKKDVVNIDDFDLDDTIGKVLSGDYDEQIKNLYNGQNIRTVANNIQPDYLDSLIDSGDVDDLIENIVKKNSDEIEEATGFNYNHGLQETKLFDKESVNLEDFKTGGKYKDALNKEFAYSQGMNPEELKQLGLNDGKIVNQDVGRMENIIVGLDNMLGNKFKLTELPDEALDDLLEVLNSNDKVALADFLDDLSISKNDKMLGNSKLWDKGLINAQQTTGLNIKNTKPYYKDADGNKIDVPLEDIPKVAQDFVTMKQIRSELGFIPDNFVAEDLLYKQGMLDSFAKQTGMSIEELADLNPALLKQFTATQKQYVYNLYNKFNGTKKGYDFSEFNKGKAEADKYLKERNETNLFEDLKDNRKTNANVELESEYANKIDTKEYKYSDRELDKTINLFGENGSFNKYSPDKYKNQLVKYFMNREIYNSNISDTAKQVKYKAVSNGIYPDDLIAKMKSMDTATMQEVKRDYAKKQEYEFTDRLNKMSEEQVANKALIESTDENVANWYNRYFVRRFGKSNEMLQEKMSMFKPKETAKATTDNTVSNSLGSFKPNEVRSEEDILKDISNLNVLDNETVDKVSKLMNNRFSYNVSKINNIVKESKPDKFYDLAKYISQEFRRIGYEEYKAGRLTKEQFETRSDAYLTHILTDDAKKYFLKNFAEDFKYGFNPVASAQGYKKHFDQARKYNTIEEANKSLSDKFKDADFDKWFEDDVAKIIEARSLASNELLYSDSVTKAIKSVCGKEYKVGEKINGYTPVIPFVELNKFLMKKYDGDIPDEVFSHLGLEKEMFTPNQAYIPVTDDMVKKIDEMTDGINNVPPQAFNLDDNAVKRFNTNSAEQVKMHQSDLLNLYDKWLLIYKQWNSSINPGFHVQNSVSGVFQNFLADGATMFDPKKYKEAFNIVRDKSPNKTIEIHGQEITYEQLKKLAERNGVLNHSYFKADLDVGSDGMLDKHGINGKYDPTSNEDFIPYKVGRNVGSTIENTQRMALFVKHLEDGDSIESAVNNVNKFLFDYSDITEFEQDVVKRIVPFYTFMKKNIPMELEAMLNTPQRFALIDKGFTNIEKMNGDAYEGENDRPEWRKDYVQLPITVDGESVGINPELPYQQLDRVSSIGKLLGQTAPLVKAPLEILSGKYLYNGMEIESPLDYLASQTTPTKLLSVAGKKEGADRDMYILGQLLGLPIGKM